MQVTISTSGGLHVDDYWCIGVRPSTPSTVYPDRYLRTAQPPDGPQQWVCPLAVIEWQGDELVVLEDCRYHFPSLVDVDDSGCCTIEVRPSDAASGKLQALLDKAAAGRVLGDRAGRVTICFEPGRYELAEPLVIRQRHSNLTLRGCTEAAVISAKPGAEAQFGQGLFILADADNVTITGFEFELPQVPAAIAKISGAASGAFTSDVTRAINAELANRYVSIAIRPINCAVLEISDCLFRFTLGEHQGSLAAEQTMPRNVFGIGIFAAGGCWGLRLTRNRFLHEPEIPIDDQGVRRALVGYLLTPTATTRAVQGKAVRARGALGTARLQAILEDAIITDNTFVGISAAVVALAELGTIRVWDNVVADCYGGVWLVDVAAAANTDIRGVYKLPTDASGQVGYLSSAVSGGLLDPVLLYLLLVGETYPIPVLNDFILRHVVQLDTERISELRSAADTEQSSRMIHLVGEMAAEHTPPTRTTRARKSTAAAATDDKAATAKAAPAADATVSFNPTTGAQTGTAPAMDQPVTPTNRPSRNLLTAWGGLSELARLDPTPDAVTASLRLERNTIDCDVPRDQSTGPAVFVYVTPKLASVSSAIIGDNRLTSPNATITALILGLAASTITGNIVAGEVSDNAFALAVSAIRKVAITGNVITGRAVLPENRPFPAPLDTWLPLNTID
jgi:hypothetical protein